METFLIIMQIVAEALAFIGPLALVVYYLRAHLGLSGRENPYGAPAPKPSAVFNPKVIVSVWVLAVAVMLVLRWRQP